MSTLLHSPVCELLGCRVPIVLAGMGGVSRADLVAAVSAAGGFGFLGMVREDPALIVEEVEHLRGLGHQCFGVNIIPAATDPVLLEDQVAACIRLGVPVVGTFWDLDERLVVRLRDAGIVVAHQVGSVDEAIAAERAGVQIIIAQGCEAGGHVRGVTPLGQLLPAVAGAVNVPVLAAGGLVTGGDLVSALALGAEGIVLGTAMLATEESFAHAYHKQRIFAAEAQDTMLTTDFHINWPPGAPVRVLNSAVTSGARGTPSSPVRTVVGEENGRPIYLFSTDSPLRSMTGDFESMALYAGTGVGRISERARAGDRLENIVAEAEALLAGGPDTVDAAELSSPVCYVGEMSGTYNGHLDEREMNAELQALGADLQVALHELLAREVGNATAPKPPFTEAATRLARASLIVRRLGGARSTPRGDVTAPDLLLVYASILGRLRATLPRVPEGRIRDRLAQVLALLETDRPVLGVSPGSPRPVRHSTESLAAFDQ
ncbi:MAG: nitronate monooxygenase [Hyphomicrobiales bacterium]|nr:MAG: nitronate monooxygenase [Hyphomicrobiales bacterium]